MPMTFDNPSDCKAEFVRLYHELDQLDLRAGTTNLNENIVQPIGTGVTPDDGAGMGAGQPASITLQDSAQINYRRRALSYFHGAVIAVQRSALEDTEQRIAIETLAALYNQYEDPIATPTQTKAYAKLQTPHSFDGLKKFVKLLQGTLKTQGISASDLKAGEKLANLERPRPKTFTSQTGQALVTETPLNSQMNHEALVAQYDFTRTLKADDQNYGKDQRHALYTYENKGNLGKGFLYALAGIGWALEKCGVNSNSMLGYFINKLEAIRNKNKALQALTTAKAPKWYRKQNRVVREYLLDNPNDNDLPALPATLRGIPGLPNMSAHEGLFTGDSTVTNTVIRHGTLTPYEMTAWKEREQAAYANGKALMSIILPRAEENHGKFWSPTGLKHDSVKEAKIQIADISLMSPAHGEKGIGTLVREKTSVFSERPKNLKESNRGMKKENQAAYMHGVNEAQAPDQHEMLKKYHASTINLGINGDRWKFSTTFQSRNYSDQVRATLRTFEKIQRAVDSKENKQVMFNDTTQLNKFKLAEKAAGALADINGMFNETYSTNSLSDEAKISKLINAELFASCLYAIVIQGMGGTVSACCKSSKDRTGLFLIHLDAMHQFYAETGRLIDFRKNEHDADRIRFVDIMSDLYLSNMQQTMASQATYGAAGLKEPKGVGGALSKYKMDMSMPAVPEDLEKAINKKCPGLLREQGKLAKSNKMKV